MIGIEEDAAEASEPAAQATPADAASFRTSRRRMNSPDESQYYDRRLPKARVDEWPLRPVQGTRRTTSFD